MVYLKVTVSTIGLNKFSNYRHSIVFYNSDFQKNGLWVCGKNILKNTSNMVVLNWITDSSRL